MNKNDFKLLLERAIAKAKAEKNGNLQKSAEALKATMEKEKVVEVDTSLMGITNETLKTEEGREAAVEIIQEVISGSSVSKESSGGSKDISSRSKELDANLQSSKQEDPAKEKKDLGVARDIILNKKQQEAHDRVIINGESICLIGSAGTGKTTSMRKITRSLIDSGRLPKLTTGTKYLAVGAYGAIIVSFTRKAVNNIRHAVVEELKGNTLTVHKALEFAPEFFEIEDPANPGNYKKTMRFVPMRNKHRPLPPEIIFVAHEETSMEAVDLYNLLREAMPHAHQEMLLGDIQQLPPVFGSAVLGFKMLELPVVELTEIYRQAAESPIISLAWKLLEGNPHDFSSRAETHKIYSEHVKKEVTRITVPALEKLSRTVGNSTVKFQPWQKSLSADNGLITCVKQFCQWIEQGYYNPDDDIILCPYNKAFGTIEINKGIQQFLGRRRNAIVHETVAGFNKHYLAVGDRVLYDKEDAFITSITRNGQYLGKSPSTASEHLDRWGTYQEDISNAEKANAHAVEMEMSDKDLELLMSSAAGSSEDRVNSASHIITIRYAFSDEEEVIESAADVNNLLGGNAITFHKSQGSEWKRCFIVLHNSHAVMCSRELLYTGVTRAREFLHIICEPTTFERGVKSQRIKGNTLAEKAEVFKGKNDGIIPIRSSSLPRNVSVATANSSSRAISTREDAGVRATLSSQGSNPLQERQPTLAERLEAIRLKKQVGG